MSWGNTGGLSRVLGSHSLSYLQGLVELLPDGVAQPEAREGAGGFSLDGVDPRQAAKQVGEDDP
jgi:hypothetical protein